MCTLNEYEEIPPLVIQVFQPLSAFELLNPTEHTPRMHLGFDCSLLGFHSREFETHRFYSPSAVADDFQVREHCIPLPRCGRCSYIHTEAKLLISSWGEHTSPWRLDFVTRDDSPLDFHVSENFCLLMFILTQH
jgi:hypothetical protein